MWAMSMWMTSKLIWIFELGIRVTIRVRVGDFQGLFFLSSLVRFLVFFLFFHLLSFLSKCFSLVFEV